MKIVERVHKFLQSFHVPMVIPCSSASSNRNLQQQSRWISPIQSSWRSDPLGCCGLVWFWAPDPKLQMLLLYVIIIFPIGFGGFRLPLLDIFGESFNHSAFFGHGRFQQRGCWLFHGYHCWCTANPCATGCGWREPLATARLRESFGGRRSRWATFNCQAGYHHWL